MESDLDKHRGALVADTDVDAEKRGSIDLTEEEVNRSDEHLLYSNRWTRKLLSWGVEERGITPVAEHERTDTQFYKIFFIFLSANFNILSFSAGTLGPVTFGLGLRDSCLVILFFNLLCSIPPAYLYERLAWIPVLVVFVVALGVGGKHLSNPPPAVPATASSILTFAGTIAGFVVTYSPISSDYTIYYHPKVSSWRLFWYAYMGLNLPIILVQCLGAAVAVSVSAVPDWNTGYENSGVGGLIEAMLHPVGGFGKFLTVLVALSVVGNVAPSLYSFGLGFQIFMPFTSKVPRYVFSLLAIAIMLPLSIVGSHKFYDTLSNFLGIIGYWCSAFVGVIVGEHIVFRKNDFTAYDLSAWNKPGQLPPGLAALGACLLSCGLIIPSMDQAWFVGPIAKHTGDIGFEMAFAAAGILYLPLRTLELRYWKMR
ncbi:hypothetical protein EUX98_g1617 [Antrodiella citrinella]|uniref:Purine-cytosine permease n=1 Tax=Antrodiella citrinella TaxID=2447956 RepID=A0A4V3XJB8_9APHY|nr:hypothetical protein EUX98_g1617 [Antrodiella citrinella]